MLAYTFCERVSEIKGKTIEQEESVRSEKIGH